MEVLSEHCCQGWLEGYLLTGGMACGLPTKPCASRGFNVDATCQVLEQCRISLAQTARVVERSIDKSCVAK